MTRTQSTRSRWLLLPLTVALAAACSLACARTDANRYGTDDSGISIFKNTNRQKTIWLQGCNVFVQQEKVGEVWVDRGGDLNCFWEGFAQPVPPRGMRSDPFTARTPGQWRLAYDVGFGCSATEPFSSENCALTSRIFSNVFDVIDPLGDQALCTASGGAWDPLSCGHYSCGYFPECDAIIPGCDCGPGGNFEPGVGCVDDPTCPDVEQMLCEDTGGVWDPTSCGHWSCGNRPICAAVIPGCNCGPFSVFVEGVGCLAAPCGAPQ